MFHSLKTTDLSIFDILFYRKVYAAFFSLSFMLVGVVGLLTTIIVGVIISFIAGNFLKNYRNLFRRKKKADTF